MTEKVSITESGMVFGDFDSESLFHIEKSDVYKKLGDGIKSVEFLYLRDRKKLMFVEAKKSSPNTDNIEKFEEFIEEITTKFIHSFELWMSLVTKRREADIAVPLVNPEMDKVNITFVLVIKDHKEEWLPPITRAINSVMMPYLKIWQSKAIALNDEIAKKWQLILESA